jgi:glyceraldehyde 3-phosphate dehydrogenase (phosphorylating)
MRSFGASPTRFSMSRNTGQGGDRIVSTDIIHVPRASIIDCTLTQVVDGDLVKVMSWYDNEWGYAAQLVREAKTVAGPIR